MLDYLAIGHIAQDLAPDGVRPGGTVAYGALTAHALGLKAGILTSAAPEAVLTGLENISLRIVPSPFSTTFENRYTAQGRIQTLYSLAAPLAADSIPAEWRTASIVHLAPIAQEVDADVVSVWPHAFIGLTPQGWMRRWDVTGRISRTEWNPPAELLARANAVVISLDDVGGDWSAPERWAAAARALVVTQAEQGATVFWKRERRHFPAPKVKVVDATGAGDIFAAAFFVRLWQNGEAWGAARLAVQWASDSVTRVGIDGVPKDQQSGDRRQETGDRSQKLSK